MSGWETYGLLLTCELLEGWPVRWIHLVRLRLLRSEGNRGWWSAVLVQRGSSALEVSGGASAPHLPTPLLPAPPAVLRPALLPRPALGASQALDALEHSLALGRVGKTTQVNTDPTAESSEDGMPIVCPRALSAHRLQKRRDVPLDLSLLLIRQRLQDRGALTEISIQSHL